MTIENLLRDDMNVGCKIFQQFGYNFFFFVFCRYNISLELNSKMLHSTVTATCYMT